MILYPGDDLTRTEIAQLAKEAGSATFDALRAAGTVPDLSSTKVFELIFNAMIVARDTGVELASDSEASSEQQASSEAC